MVRVILAIALALVITACSAVGQEPTAEVIGRAIAVQLSQTQQELSQQLRLVSTPQAIQVSHLQVNQQTSLKIQDLPSYRVQGSCDYTIQQANHSVTQRNTPFEVYLQRQPDGKTWQLASLKSKGLPLEAFPLESPFAQEKTLDSDYFP
jgi:outer membrane biogenesis lipoprotein LolB